LISDGETLRELESQSNVKIKIDLKKLSYTIAGSPQDIEKAKDIIKEVTVFICEIRQLLLFSYLP
jgi:rRNA processing protein Krr1/Pno1